jgi:hypothetical protein
MRPIPHPFDIPGKPRLSRMLNDLRENCQANILRDLRGGTFSRTANGTYAAVKAQRGGGAGALVQKMIVIGEVELTTSVAFPNGNPSPVMLKCMAWEDAADTDSFLGTASGDIIYVTKPFYLQNLARTDNQYDQLPDDSTTLQISYAPVSQVFGGVGYASPNKRNSTYGSFTTISPVPLDGSGNLNYDSVNEIYLPVYNEVIWPGYLSQAVNHTTMHGLTGIDRCSLIQAVQIPVDKYGNTWEAIPDRDWWIEIELCSATPGGAPRATLIKGLPPFLASNALDFTSI